MKMDMNSDNASPSNPSIVNISLRASELIHDHKQSDLTDSQDIKTKADAVILPLMKEGEDERLKPAM